MNTILKVSAFLVCIALTGSSQTIDNVQFTDMSGKEYDLHALLESGKHVICHFQFNT